MERERDREKERRTIEKRGRGNEQGSRRRSEERDEDISSEGWPIRGAALTRNQRSIALFDR